MLKEKILKTGSYYVAQQVDYNIYELSEHGFDEKELIFLDRKGLEYIERIITETYKPFDDLTSKEIQAIKDGLKDYVAYGLVNDWSLGICDFKYDRVMGRYLRIKEKEFVGRPKTMEDHNKLYSRLYATIMSVRDGVY